MITKTVVCVIQVISMHFASRTEVKGIVIAESLTNYVVDFSKEAIKEHYDGDYSAKIVNKENCVELK